MGGVYRQQQHQQHQQQHRQEEEEEEEEAPALEEEEEEEEMEVMMGEGEQPGGQEQGQQEMELPQAPAPLPLRQAPRRAARLAGVARRVEAAAAKAEPVTARPARRTDVIAVGQHFTEEVRRELVARFGPDQTVMGGLVVRTSLDPALQAATETALRNGLLAYDRRRGGWRGRSPC